MTEVLSTRKKRNRERMRLWAIALASFVEGRTAFLMQKKVNPEIGKPGNGSGTYLESHGRAFIITAKHVALGFAADRSFQTIPRADPGALVKEESGSILDVRYHDHRDVALLEIPKDLPKSLGYYPLTTSEIHLNYLPDKHDRIMWVGYPEDLRTPSVGNRGSTGYHYGITWPILRPESKRSRLAKHLSLEFPFDPKYDFFALRRSTSMSVESGKVQHSQFDIQGISGGGIWKVHKRPHKALIADPSKSVFTGVECSKISMPGPDTTEWVRATRGLAVLETLSKFGINLSR